MKLIVAIIKPFRLDEVRESLNTLGVDGFTVTEVKGFGQQTQSTEVYRGAEYIVDYLPKIKLEIIIHEAMVDSVILAIQNITQSGTAGDGKIFVINLEKIIHIRTGEVLA
ncbi:MAG: P-II family nitrogen regulator [Endozoicomonadaceae bacterium]|nr:P-II family nitrogen regulator [Endozoicomonadaceae bacterium]